ncbi:MAG TPA: hypothetical protein VEX18_17075 [Polyangiaceae bacterium]|nr:hypothetical protein [Polyangiaceae bacterium]
MRRHLPLLGTAAPEIVLGEAALAARDELGPASIGVADPDSGLAAVVFALELALAFRERSASVQWTLLGYQGVPMLDRALAAQLAAAGISTSRHAVDPAVAPSRAVLSPGEPSDVTLWVGQPALGAYRPALSVLLQTHHPIGSWPAVLRAVRPSCQLALTSPRAGLASMLAEALIKSGFLPGR